MFHLLKNRNDITRYNIKNNIKTIWYHILHSLIGKKECVQMTVFGLLKAEKAILMNYEWRM